MVFMNNNLKATAVAPANIALIKYWGKAHEDLRIPLNSSISMNMSGAITTTTIEFSKHLTRDSVTLLPDKTNPSEETKDFSDKEADRIVRQISRIRERAKTSMFARVVTQNSFPKSSGAASSASGFAAITVAASEALGLRLSQKELTILARLGSGSACRSIPDGFVLWEKGNTSEDSYAYSLYPSAYWDLRDVFVIVDRSAKKISTSDGMKNVTTSPFLRDRLERVPERIELMKTALQKKDIELFGHVLEEDCLSMHLVMQTQVPPAFYWNAITESIMKSVAAWRADGLKAYFTIDAGPNVHLMCEAKDEKELSENIQTLPGVQSVIINKPAPGAHLVSDHLF